MRHNSDNLWIQNQSTHFMLNFFSTFVTPVEQNVIGRQATYENIIWCSYFAKWVNKARDSGSQYLKFTDF